MRADEHTLLGGRVRLVQPADGLRATTDTVLLAAAVPARAGDLVFDVGCGTGAAALCLAARVATCRIVGVDRDAALARAARANARRNGVADRVRFRVATVGGRWPAALAGADHVLTNPPYLEPSRAARGGASARRDAMVEAIALADWIAACLAALRPKGTLTLIQRADRLADVLAALSDRAGGIVVMPLWPRAGQPAKRVLVHARKGSHRPLTLAAGLVLHEADGRYTRAADDILRHAAPLPMALDGGPPGRQDRGNGR